MGEIAGGFVLSWSQDDSDHVTPAYWYGVPMSCVQDALLGRLALVVLSHERRDEIHRNMPALIEAADRNGMELVIVDNGSRDGSQELLMEMCAGKANVRLVLNSNNKGVAGGRNDGWNLATREIIVNIDEDTIVTVEDLVRLVRIADLYPDAALVFPRVRDHQTGRDLTPFGDVSCTPGNFLGGCHLVRRAAFLQVGNLDEGCRFGGEELDYSIRARSLGYEVVFDPSVEVRHNGLVRSGDQARWRRSQWMYNYVRVLFKHFPARVASVFAFRCIVAHVVSGVRTCGISFVPLLLVSASRGMRDGLRTRSIIPGSVVDFYRDPALRPDLGNVPITTKVRGILLRVRSRRVVGE